MAILPFELKRRRNKAAAVAKRGGGALQAAASEKAPLLGGEAGLGYGHDTPSPSGAADADAEAGSAGAGAGRGSPMRAPQVRGSIINGIVSRPIDLANQVSPRVSAWVRTPSQTTLGHASHRSQRNSLSASYDDPIAGPGRRPSLLDMLGVTPRQLSID